MEFRSFERRGWDRRKLSDAQFKELGRLLDSGQEAKAAIKHVQLTRLADRFPIMVNQEWFGYFTAPVEISSYNGPDLPDELTELLTRIKIAGASKAWLYRAPDGECLVVAEVQTSEGPKRLRIAQWHPTGACTPYSMIDHASKRARGYLALLGMGALVIFCGLVFELSHGSSWKSVFWAVALYPPLIAATFAGRLRRRLIRQSRERAAL